MPDEIKSDQKEGNARGHSDDEVTVHSSFEPTASDVTQPEPNSPTGNSGNNAEPTARPYRDRLASLARRVQWLTLFNIVVGAGAASQSYFACRANDLTRESINRAARQHGEILNQSKAMNDAALAQNERATNASLGETRRSNMAAERAAEASERAAKSAEASNNVARTAVTEARRATVNSQRAWVGVDEPVTIHTILRDPQLIVKYDLPLRNFGQSPAFNVEVLVRLTDGEVDTNQVMKEVCDATIEYFEFTDPGVRFDRRDRRNARTVFPGHVVSVPLRTGPWGAQKNTSSMGFLIGCIVYADIFGVRRQTEFCYTSMQTLNNIDTNTALTQCWFGNYAR